jgi:hypothetical protein
MARKTKKTAEEPEVRSVKDALLKLDKARRSQVLAAVDKFEYDARQAEYNEVEAEIEKARKDKDIIKYVRLLNTGDMFAGNHCIDFEGFFKFILKQGAEIVEIIDDECVRFKLPDSEGQWEVWAAREKILVRIIQDPGTDFSIKKDVIRIRWS